MGYDLFFPYLHSPTCQLIFRINALLHSIHLTKRIIVQDFMKSRQARQTDQFSKEISCRTPAAPIFQEKNLLATLRQPISLGKNLLATLRQPISPGKTFSRPCDNQFLREKPSRTPTAAIFPGKNRVVPLRQPFSREKNRLAP